MHQPPTRMDRELFLTSARITDWLREEDEGRLNVLWKLADDLRRQRVGDDVHLRGLVEISNHCLRRCAYCGINADNSVLPRYRMNAGEILECARRAKSLGFGTVVLQSGEDYGLTALLVSEVVRSIKGETGLAVTLSLGERPERDLAAWRAAGADRYLLRFETSDERLYARIHPPLAAGEPGRVALLGRLKRLDYETGSGVMVGLPGQRYESLADDVALFRRLDLDMIGIGPFIPHPGTALGQNVRAQSPAQVPATELMALKMLALARLACPEANIPATTAIATLDGREGYERALRCGANVVMPELTPWQYRALYEIYPGKAASQEDGEAAAVSVVARIRAVGRTVGAGPGSRRRGDQAPAAEGVPR